MRLYVYIIIVFLANSISLYCQEEDYGWWNDHVEWDGVSHWSKYLTYSPASFGVNALPVPQLRGGRINSNSYISIGTDFFFSEDEHVENLKIDFSMPFAQGKVGLFGSWIPYEHFRIDQQAALDRNIRDRDGTGQAIGDLIIGMSVSLLQNKTYWPDLVLTTTMRTALGTNRAAGRYTDAPGYSFDLSMGRDVDFSQFKLRPIGMIGLYVWQTNEDKNPQNDALLYGGGIDIEHDDIQLQCYVSGYSGYKQNGDQPISAHLEIIKKYKNVMIHIPYEYRFRDFQYQKIGFKLSYIW